MGAVADSVEQLVRRGYEGAWNEGDVETLLTMAAAAGINPGAA